MYELRFHPQVDKELGDLPKLAKQATERDRAVQKRIYATELKLMDRFPAFSYDFNVIFCHGEIAAILPSEAEIIYP